MNIKSLTLTGALLLPTAAFAQAADPVAGAALADKHCNQCHGSEVYTRAERRVTSRAGLSKQVRRCELALGLKWFDEDIENVAEHLNQSFYRFPNP